MTTFLVCCSLSQTASAQESVSAPEEQLSHPPQRQARMLLASCAELPFDQEQLTSILAAELAGLGVLLCRGEGGPDCDPEAIRIVIDVPRCSPADPEVRLRVEPPEFGFSLERVVDLRTAASADRPRILAIAASELLRQSLASEHGASGDVQTEPDADGVDEEAEPPEMNEVDRELSMEERAEITGMLALEEARRQQRNAERPGRLLFEAAVEGRGLPTTRTGLIGGRVGLSALVGVTPVRLDVDAGVSYGLGSDSLGHIDMVITGLGLGVLFQNRGPRPASLGPRVEVSWAWVHGRPYDGETLVRTGSAVVVTLALRLRLLLTVSQRGWFLLAVDVGAVVRGFEALADGRSAAGIMGPSFNLVLGYSYDLRG